MVGLDALPLTVASYVELIPYTRSFSWPSEHGDLSVAAWVIGDVLLVVLGVATWRFNCALLVLVRTTCGTTGGGTVGSDDVATPNPDGVKQGGHVGTRLARC